MNVKIKSLYRTIQNLDVFELGISGLFVLIAIHFSGFVLVSLNIRTPYVGGHSDMVTAKSLFFALFGTMAFGLGYWTFSNRTLARKSSGIFQKPWKWERVIYIFLGLFGAGFATKFYHIATGAHLQNMYLDPADPLFFFKFFISLNPFHFMALALAFTAYYALLKEKFPEARLWGFLAWSTFSFEVLCGLLNFGGRLGTLIPILIFLISKHYLHQRSLVRIVVAGLLVVLVLFPVKNILRDIPSSLNTYLGGNQEVFTYHKLLQNTDFFYSIENGEIFELARYRQLNINTENTLALAIDGGMGRIGQGHVFSAIVEQTKEYFYGIPILYTFNQLGIPNSLIERISGMGTGTEFGMKYGLVNEALTGVGPTTMGDWYLNFSLAGVIFGMLIYGIFFRKLYELFIQSGALTGILIYSIIWIVLMHGLEQSISASIGKFLQFSLILWFVHLGLTLDVPSPAQFLTRYFKTENK